MACSRCGNDLKTGKSFCSCCGVIVEQYRQTFQQSNPYVFAPIVGIKRTASLIKAGKAYRQDGRIPTNDL